ncbi:MAG: class I SAM-dependent methyltransferase [Acidobacteria bacterium]|nr:class I SAM-dependent methyltransferase [Acidobacteriota bacterium]
MSTYVYMKVLESAPERYDRGIHRLSGGTIASIYERVAERVAAPGRRVLDVGCGTGGVALACAARGARVVGIDVNPGMLSVARDKAARRLPAPDVDWIELGAMELEDRFAPGSFDAVTSCLAFSELSPDERRYVLRVALRLLHPGGSLVIADEVPPRRRAARVWRRVRRLPVVFMTWALTQTSTHPVGGLADAVRAAGFADVVEERLGRDDFAIVSGRRAAGAS